MALNTHNSNAYTDREKMLLIPVFLVGLTAIGVFCYVYTTIPSQLYALTSHAEANEPKAAGDAHAGQPHTPEPKTVAPRSDAPSSHK